MTYEDFWKPLQTIYDSGEAKAIARMVMEMAYGLTMTDIVCGQVEALDEQSLLHIRQQLLKGEPVQYVLGEAPFGDRLFFVEPGVLIPRPETFELCQWIVNSQLEVAANILDIGTGSGCIACTLAAELPQAQVTACDISPTALTIAAKNASRHHVRVTFAKVDILDSHCWTMLAPSTPWDIIVSNPPYICQSERANMEANVLEHEPELALFVPDDDPLRFYRSIATYAADTLAPGGRLFFEINPLYDHQLEELLGCLGFTNTVIHTDEFGKNRFICTCKQTKK